MSTLLTDLDIVNAACAMIGEEPLQSLEEEVDAGQAAALLYATVLEFNLGIGNFAFSKQVRQLSRDDTTPALAGFEHVYDMPAERIGDPLYLTDDPTDPDRRFSRYQIVGIKIHCDPEEMWAMIRYRPAPAHWSGPFKRVMIASMAAELAISLAHDRALSEQRRTEAYGTPSENFRGGLMRAALTAEGYTQPPRAQNRDANPLTQAWLS